MQPTAQPRRNTQGSMGTAHQQNMKSGQQAIRKQQQWLTAGFTTTRLQEQQRQIISKPSAAHI